MNAEEAKKLIAAWEDECEWARKILRSSFLDVPESEAELVVAAMGACGALGRKGPRSASTKIAEHARFIGSLRGGDYSATCTCTREGGT